MMKRFHVHVAVEDLAQSVRFYASLFGHPPTVQKSDYAKWMLEDPRVNFAISQHGAARGVEHLGFQVDSADELQALTQQLRTADIAVQDEHAATCCYAQSDKGWIHDPQGIAWEAFVTHGQCTTYGGTRASSAASCAPQAGAGRAVPQAPMAQAAQAAEKRCCG
jgi:catechol 2,3-dioxygenase-like lactoylglutathione lyase family enzyme